MEIRKWYFVCMKCTAKFFAPDNRRNCPRCGWSCLSFLKIIPPWIKR
jgi:DNA-directed RNA polymerase subunit RPC12/RpoP